MIHCLNFLTVVLVWLNLNAFNRIVVSSINDDYMGFEETDPRYWRGMARQNLNERLQTHRPIHHQAKNVILFLGDGMGISTITASRILKGQLEGKKGEEGWLEFDRFPFSALIKVPDSAGTATAYLTGVKSNFYTLGVSAKVPKDSSDCQLVNKSSVSSILQWALDSGKAAGVVTTTRITHATPGASYAHTQNRDWEESVNQSILDASTRHQCKDIARQLIEDYPGRSLNVILGGGRQSFLPKDEKDPKGMKNLNNQIEEVYGKRRDGKNLIEEWDLRKKTQGLTRNLDYAYVNSTRGLRALKYKNLKYLLGLFNYTHLEYEQLRDRSDDGEPSLTEMIEAAIRVLSNNQNGFVLLVEGGRIDHAHHDGFATMALHETVEFDRAIQKARELLPPEETLILVTADHSHSMVINGYPHRGNKIQGFSNSRDSNDLPFTTLLYTNGPGFRPLKVLKKTTYDDIDELKFRVLAAVHLKESNHGGEDVAIFGTGPMAHMFGGTHEQSYIAHVIGFAACIGDYKNEPHCHEKDQEKRAMLKEQTPLASRQPKLLSSSSAIKKIPSTKNFSSWLYVFLVLVFAI